MKALITSTLLLSTVTLIGCNPTAVLQTRKAQAPTSNEEAGYIVKAESEQQIIELLNQNPKAEYRMISKTDELYEIFNLKSSELNKTDLQVLTKNRMVYLKPNNLNLGLELLAESDSDNLPTCATRTAQGKVKIKQAKSLENKTVLQEEILLEPTQLTEGNRYFWMVAAPQGSKYDTGTRSPYILQSESFQFSPDSLGGHAIQLVVETKTKHCELHLIRTLITKNTPYKKLGTPLTENAQADVHHLEMIQAYEAQSYTKGEGVVVAVIDSGVNYLHQELNAQIQVNSKEIPNNNIDDDNNGYVDDYAGYDFQNDDPHAYDDSGHGTHVSGLIAGQIHGVAPNAKIMPLKALGDFGGDLGSIYGALLYAIENGADIVNMSLGHGGSPDPLESFAMSKAEDAGVLVVTAAGNGNQYGVGIDTDKSGVYPANLPHSNLLNVAAMSFNKDITRYSNYGKTTVDISAPGGSPEYPIESLAHENPQNASYAKMMGTSMAAPVTTGAVALALSLNPEMTPQQTIELTLQNGDDVESLKDKTKSGKRINALSMVYQNKLNQLLTAN